MSAPSADEAAVRGRGLFSAAYLAGPARAMAAWGDDASHAWARARALWEERGARLEGQDAAATAREWVRPVLEDVLGWAAVARASIPELASLAGRPALALFAGEAERAAAWAARGDDRRYYAAAAAVADVAPWAAPLDLSLRGAAAPAFHAAASLATSGAEWAVLTNGREWRLYAARARSRVDTFLSVDLARALETGDEEAFRAFFVFFRAASFRPDPRLPNGRAFADAVLDGSAGHVEETARRLRDAVLNDVFERLARGFVDGRRRRGIVDADEGALALVHLATSRLLHRLLFLFAESGRGDGDGAIEAIRRRIADRRDAGTPLRPTSAEAWDELRALFDRSGSAPGAPAPFRADDEAGAFLRENPVSDLFLVHALDHLSRLDGAWVDYGALTADRLGAVCEPLLEHRLVAGEGGKPVLAGEKGERKASGTHHAPRWAVEYVVSEALEGALAEREEAFRRAMDRIGGLRGQLRLAGGEDDRVRIESELEATEADAVEVLLDLRICDPAMGSGAFLLHAADHVAERWMALLAAIPRNPLSAYLAVLREEIAAASGIDPASISEAVLLKRMVARRCVFGVDLDPAAVELARTVLQLDSIVPGAPLPFLDHHLRRGNALVGTRVADVQRALEADPRGQLSAFGGPFRDLLRALDRARDVARAEDATADEAGRSAAKQAELDRETAPYRRLLDAWVSAAFGNRAGPELVSLHGDEALAEARGGAGALAPAHRDALERAGETAGRHAFFHWDLEFPEAFADGGRGVWHEDPGFDAVVGNPPYARPEQAAALKPYLASTYADAHDGGADLSSAFARRSLALLRGGGRLSLLIPSRWLRAGQGEGLRRYLASHAEIERVVDFAGAPVFADADVAACVLVVRRPTRALDRAGEARVAAVPREAVGSRGLAAWVAAHAHAVPRDRFGAAPWSLAPRAVEALMEKIRAAGVPLRDYAGAAPLAGVRTGLNDAFLVDTATRDRLVTEDPRSDDLIRPYLRAQDVERWSPGWAGTWLIFARRGIAIDHYPAVLRHLERFRAQLEPRPAEWAGERWEGRRAGPYRWFELHDPVDHPEALEGPKIVWRELSFHSQFCWDAGGLFPGDGCFALPTDDAWLLAVLSSPLMWYFASRTVVHGKDEVLRLKNVYTETLPVAAPTAEVRAEAASAAERLVELSRERRGVEGGMLEWLRAEYDVAQPGPRLEAFAELSATGFVDEVKARRPKKADPLTPVQVGRLRNAHAESAPRLTAVAAKIAGLERRMSLLVNRAYGLTPEEVELMWSTAPPRMPVGR